jgi:putative transcriptional regulator
MNRIREIREAAGITQADLRRKLNWGQARLANYELGTRKPGLEEARAVAKALRALGAKCTLDDDFPPQQSTKSAA